MKVTLGASTGTKIDFWRENDLFHAQRADESGEPQTCLGVDLFEVIAELVHLDLEDQTQGAEAASLAECAKRRLGAL
jgi:hypothetical protein